MNEISTFSSKSDDKNYQHSRTIKALENFRKVLFKSFENLDLYFQKTNYQPKDSIIDSLKDDIFKIQEKMNNCFLTCKMRDSLYTECNREDCNIKCIKMGEIDLLENEFKYSLLMEKGENQNLKQTLNDSFEFKQRQLTFEILKKYL